ncbi:hypothetical protein CBM2637_A150027 [Cupriavidus taiwanensis]|uniref:hypothetical protein n=1 Tax=Cupriavidus taiwanensis TaxID=164546 RepID=UPI000E1A7C5D|nr:hypothetical protein [Cupriavidus taiwanensis]SPA24574.1 hypothetical protein CBM2637_A150027 [Cupriavidus taiwanensis]
MDDQQRIDVARAERARLILDDELVKGALSAMKARIVEAWEQSPVRDVEGREHLHRYLKVIGQFEGALRSHIETGKIAAHEIRAEEERKTLMERVRAKIYG